MAVTIDSPTWPYKALLLRGPVQVDEVEGVAPEYRQAAARYFGAEQGEHWCDQLPDDIQMTRFTMTPQWVGVLDFEEMRRIPARLAD